MAETIYLRVTASTADCVHASADQQMSVTQGSSATTQDVSSAVGWDFAETARSIQAGNWTADVDITTGGGGGAGPRCTLTLQRIVMSSCTVQQTIGTEEIDIAKSTSAELQGGPWTPGSVTFAAGEGLLLTVQRTRGTVTMVCDYDGSTSAADSRVVHPDEVVPSTGFSGLLMMGHGD